MQMQPLSMQGPLWAASLGMLTHSSYREAWSSGLEGLNQQIHKAVSLATGLSPVYIHSGLHLSLLPSYKCTMA